MPKGLGGLYHKTPSLLGQLLGQSAAVVSPPLIHFVSAIKQVQCVKCTQNVEHAQLVK